MEKAPSIFARLIGAILLFFGVGAGLLAGWTLRQQLIFNEPVDLSARFSIVALVVAAIIWLRVGIRLTMNRTNKHQSTLPPSGWRALVFVQVALSGAFITLAAVRWDFHYLNAAMLAVILAWWCWGAAKDAKARAAGTQPTPSGDLNESREVYYKLLTFRGVPIFVHHSLPMGGFLFAVYAGFDGGNVLYYCVAYFLLIGAHEAGHALAATALDLKVSSIDISGVGGLCRIAVPQKVAHAVIVYSAGILVQLIVLLATVIYVQTIGEPTTAFGRSLVATFTIANGIVLFLNIVPMKTSNGLATDGLVLWGLFLHVFWKKENPLGKYIALPANESPIFPPGTRLLTKPKLIPAGFKQGIEILNDSTTTMEFVVSVLTNHLGMTHNEAAITMLTIHNNGGILIPLPLLESAKQIAAAIASDAKQLGQPLICRAVDIQDSVKSVSGSGDIPVA